MISYLEFLCTFATSKQETTSTMMLKRVKYSQQTQQKQQDQHFQQVSAIFCCK